MSGVSEKLDPGGPDQPELIFGLIGALGADIKGVAAAIRDELRGLTYEIADDPIKLSSLMHVLPGAPFDKLHVNGKRAGVEAYMDAGTALRERLDRADALALFAVSAIRAARKAEFGRAETRPARGVAFILDSIKHHDEVRALRGLYGSAFIAVGVYTPFEERVKAVEQRLQKDAGGGLLPFFKAEAERLIRKDQDEEDKPLGQHVSDAFALADVVVSTAAESSSSVQRFIRLLFGDWTKTPTRDEVGMAHAQIAAYQSSSMARQVGAAICRPDGSIVATGTNEVPRAGGGIFDADDLANGEEDVRDFSALGYDTSDDQRRELLEDVLERLVEEDLLPTITAEQVRTTAQEMLRGGNPIMKRAKFMATIDYIRAIHAEAAALSACAQYGVSSNKCALYVTTFPCHDCAKLIIASGISRVVYIEPYAKSLARAFYDGQIDVDRVRRNQRNVEFVPFVGVAPRRYRELFAMVGKRKDSAGFHQAWDKNTAVPRLLEPISSRAARAAGEAVQLKAFDDILTARALSPQSTI